jgi:predicted AAA+ superfamily ATPase
MTPPTYLPRIVDGELERRLAANGAVVIEGAKACGKTETARRQAASEVLLDIDVAAQEAAELDPGLILPGPVPRLIDEWQVVAPVWNRVRREVDQRGTPGQFILTGSAVPADDQTRHGGAMRFGRILMRPMALSELRRSTGEISLAAILDDAASAAADPGLELGGLVDEIVRGGWPGNRDLSLDDAAQALRDYLEQIRRTDIHRVDGVQRDPQRVGAVMRSLARNVGTQAALSTIAADAAGSDAPVTYETVGSYLSALERLMVIENAEAWSTHLRSSHQLRSTPTRYFTDPSLAVAALRASPETLLGDLNYLGLLFESLVVRDLRVYSQPLDGRVYHYRDNSNLEVDAIVDCGGRWAAFEIKLGVNQVEEAAANLLKFARRVDTTRRGEPSALGVIAGSGYGYVRSDGVHVIPIGALGP